MEKRYVKLTEGKKLYKTIFEADDPGHPVVEYEKMVCPQCFVEGPNFFQEVGNDQWVCTNCGIQLTKKEFTELKDGAAPKIPEVK